MEKRFVIKIEKFKAALVPCETISLDFLREQVGCQWIEAIPAPDGYIIVDEEYLLNNPPNRNILASRYAHTRLNGTAILVNVWDCDFIPFTADEAENILKKLKEYQ